MLQDEKEGKRPLFRPKGFMEQERRMDKLRKMKQWHKKSGQDGMTAGAPLIICPSAGDEISRKMKLVCKQFKNEHEIDVKVYERGGMKVANLVRSDPLKPGTCGRENCFLCTSGGGGDCSRSGSAYRLECEECPKNNLKAHYEGETGINCYSRGLEHSQGLEMKKEENPLWKHCQLQHGGAKVGFKINSLKSFKTAFERQVNEGVRIACSKADICMNSKSEFHQPSIVRVVASLGNTNEEQTGPQQQGVRGSRMGAAGGGGELGAEGEVGEGQARDKGQEESEIKSIIFILFYYDLIILHVLFLLHL